MHAARTARVFLMVTLVAFVSMIASADSHTVVRTFPVSNGLAMLLGEGGNLAVSYGEDGVLVVDDQYARTSEKLLAVIDRLSKSPLRAMCSIPTGTATTPEAMPPWRGGARPSWPMTICACA